MISFLWYTLNFFFYPTLKLNRISLLFTASASQQFENYSLFLKNYQIHEKTKKKVFPSKSNRNLHLLLQVETVEIFLSMCYWNTSIRYGHLSICFQSKKSKAKKNGHFCFSFCVKIKKLKQEIKSQSISHICILLFLSSFLMLQPIICCNTSLYLLIITITKKELFRIKYCEPFEKTTTPIIKYLITTAAFWYYNYI